MSNLTQPTDLVERKKLEEQTLALHQKLEQQARIFDTTLSSITDFAYIFDRNGRFIYVNQALLSLWGLELEDAVGKDFFELKYPDDLAAKLQSQIQQVIDTRETLKDETPYTSPTGAGGYYEYIFSPVFDKDGNVEVVAGSTRDITQRKQTEEALRDAKLRLESMLTTNEIATWWYEPLTNRLFADKRLAHMFSVSEKDAAGGPIEAYLLAIHAEDRARVEDAVKKAVESPSGNYAIDYRVMQADGSARWLAARGKVQRDDDDKPSLFTGVVIDITDRKEVEQKLRDSEEKYRTLADALDSQVRTRTQELEQRNVKVLDQANQVRELARRLLKAQEDERRHIARELHDSAGQTLVVLCMNLARLITEATKSDPVLAKELEDTEQIVQALSKEIRTASYLLHPPLLDESGLSAALGWYVSGLAERSHIDIKLNISEDFGRLPADLSLVVFRLIQECMTNIHRHSGSKSAVIRIKRSKSSVSIEVEDRGHGMTTERLAQIQSRGSGVGIQGMRERIRQFHGDLSIDSSSEGTKITAVLPVSKSQEQE